MRERLRRSLKGLLSRLGRPVAERNAESCGIDPLAFVKRETISEIKRTFGEDRDVMLSARHARELIARDRAAHLLPRSLQRAAAPNKSIIFNAIDYNIDGARTAANLDRPMIMINVVTSIERVRRRADLDVLSIGPRSEIEIFGLRGAGFSKERIKAIDLFSYSPFVDVGDMHAMPYANNSFDVILSGWVLPYSKDNPRAAKEMIRVGRNGAIVAIANDYSDEPHETFRKETTLIQSCDQVLTLFADNVGEVFFKHEPRPPSSRMVMTVFELLK